MSNGVGDGYAYGVPHPSEYDPDEEPEWPEGMSAEQVSKLIARLAEELPQLGIYPEPHVSVERHGDHVALTMNFVVGDVAFTPRVQDPQQDEFNDQFRKLENDSLRDRVEEIKEKHRRGETPEA